MITIQAENSDGILVPASPLPNNAVMIVIDNGTYKCYFEGDELPSQAEE